MSNVTTSTDPHTSMEQRDVKGRFLRGPGRKYGSKNRHSAQLMKLIREDSMIAYQALRADMLRGERYAIELYMKYILPARTIELEGGTITDVEQAFIDGEMTPIELNSAASAIEKLKRVKDADAFAEQLDRIEALLLQQGK